MATVVKAHHITSHPRLRLSQISSGRVGPRPGPAEQSLVIVVGEVPLLLLVLLAALHQPELQWRPRHLQTEVGLAVSQEGRVGAVVPGVSTVTLHCKGEMQMAKYLNNIWLAQIAGYLPSST